MSSTVWCGEIRAWLANFYSIIVSCVSIWMYMQLKTAINFLLQTILSMHQVESGSFFNQFESLESLKWVKHSFWFSWKLKIAKFKFNNFPCLLLLLFKIYFSEESLSSTFPVLFVCSFLLFSFFVFAHFHRVVSFLFPVESLLASESLEKKFK